MTKCKHAKVLLFIQLPKKINRQKSWFLKTGKVYSHLLIGENRRKNRVVEWSGRSCKGTEYVTPKYATLARGIS